MDNLFWNYLYPFGPCRTCFIWANYSMNADDVADKSESSISSPQPSRACAMISTRLRPSAVICQDNVQWKVRKLALAPSPYREWGQILGENRLAGIRNRLDRGPALMQRLAQVRDGEAWFCLVQPLVAAHSFLIGRRIVNDVLWYVDIKQFPIKFLTSSTCPGSQRISILHTVVYLPVFITIFIFIINHISHNRWFSLLIFVISLQLILIRCNTHLQSSLWPSSSRRIQLLYHRLSLPPSLLPILLHPVVVQLSQEALVLPSTKLLLQRHPWSER